MLEKYQNLWNDMYPRLTTADGAFDWFCEIGDIANGRYNKHVLAARVGRDWRQ